MLKRILMSTILLSSFSYGMEEPKQQNSTSSELLEKIKTHITSQRENFDEIIKKLQSHVGKDFDQERYGNKKEKSFRQLLSSLEETDPKWLNGGDFIKLCKKNMVGLTELQSYKFVLYALIQSYKNNLKGAIVKPIHIARLGFLASTFLSDNSVEIDEILKYNKIAVNTNSNKNHFINLSKLLQNLSQNEWHALGMYSAVQEAFLEKNYGQNEVLFEHLKPFIVCNTTLYTQKDFLFALQQGVALLGWPSSGCKAHGNLFPKSDYIYSHDIAHLTPSTWVNGSATNKKEIASQVEVLKDYAKSILSLEERLQNPEEKERAIQAGFILIHEVSNYDGTKYLHFNPQKTPQENIFWLFGFSQSSDMGYSFLLSESEKEYAMRLLSDLPKDLIGRNSKMYPKIDYISDINYNWDATLDYIKQDLSWLKEQLVEHKLLTETK